MVGAFFAAFFLKINVIYIILVCGCIGAVRFLIRMEEVQKGDDSQ
jgi:chromate transporter